MAARYVWRRLSEAQRKELLDWRIRSQQPWHSPPHRRTAGATSIHISAACYEHESFIGFSKERMDFFAESLFEAFRQSGAIVHSWCVLPNHYHALVQTEEAAALFRELGLLHGRMSHSWNREESCRGRQVFCRVGDRRIRSERHFYATLNYVHHNPVHHRYVKVWTEWPWTSAHAYLEAVGREEAERVWRSYPLKGYGVKWDSAEL